MPAFYVPARDSRHRVACSSQPPFAILKRTRSTNETRFPGIALYRALLHQVPRIALPNDLTTPLRAGWTNPILYLIRSGFRRNKNDTSPRLITSALKSGYRFLTLLTRAHDTSSSQHGEIVAFLRERQAKFPPAPEQKSDEPATTKNPPIPLLTKVSPPGAPYPVYEPTVRPVPLAELKGVRRRVPQVELANQFSFLRVGKPQSHYLSNVLHRKNMKRQKRITFMTGLDEEARPAARLEDRWEDLIADQADREGVELVEVDDGGVTAAVTQRVEAVNEKWWKEEEEDDEGLDMSMDWLGPNYSEFGAMKGATSTQEKREGRARQPPVSGSFEETVRYHGVLHIKTQLREEMKDVMARTRVLVELVREEQRLAEEEKARRKLERRKAWEERQAQAGQTQPIPWL